MQDGLVFSGQDPLNKTHGAQIPLNLHRQRLTLRTQRIVLPWGWDTAYCPTVQGL